MGAQLRSCLSTTLDSSEDVGYVELQVCMRKQKPKAVVWKLDLLALGRGAETMHPRCCCELVRLVGWLV